MPQLKQLSCIMQWAETRAPFQEYGTVYGDGLVESFIVVPNKPQAFTIHLKSLRYIYEGLAVVVFVDGRYQANRNRVNLKPITKNSALNRTQIDFLLRQREKPIGDGVYMGREWRFDNHNIVEELPEGVKASHFDLLGTIEVLVLRCRARVPEEIDESGSSSGADSDALGEKGKRVLLHQSEDKTNNRARTDGTAEDDPNDFFMGLPFGFDGTNDENQRHGSDGAGDAYDHPGWPAGHTADSSHRRNRSYVQDPRLNQYTAYNHGPCPSFNNGNSTPTAQKHVHFDLGQQMPSHPPGLDHRQSYERTRYPTSLPPGHAYHHIPPTPIYAANLGPPSGGFPSDGPIPLWHQQYYPVPPATYAHPQAVHNSAYGTQYPPNLSHPYHLQVQSHIPPVSSFPPYDPHWPIQPPHFVFNPYLHPYGAAWSVRPITEAGSFANGNSNPAVNSNPSSDPHNSGRNQYQGNIKRDDADWASGGNNSRTSGGWNSNSDTNKVSATDTNATSAPNNGGAGWREDHKQTNNDNNTWGTTANDSNNGGGDWGNTNDNSNNDNSWESKDNNIGHTGDNTWGDDNDKNGNDSWGNDAVASGSGNSGADGNQGSSSQQDPNTNTRALFGPHGQYYTYIPRGPDQPVPDAEEEPRYDVPKKVAELSGSTKQVLPGSGYMYWKKSRAPEYIDTMEEPYARFVFKYRTKDQLEKEVGIKIDVEPTGDEAIQELQGMDKQALVEMLMRAKGALGGKIPSPPLQPTILASDKSGPVAVEPPDRTFLMYKLPELRRPSISTSKNSSDRNRSQKPGTASKSNPNSGGNSGKQDDWNSTNHNDTSWAQNNDNSWDNSGKQNTGANTSQDWNTPTENSGTNNTINWQRQNCDGPAEAPSTLPPSIGNWGDSGAQSNKSRPSNLDADWTKGIVPGTRESSPSTLPIEPEPQSPIPPLPLQPGPPSAPPKSGW